MKASTCVVDYLDFAQPTPNRQGVDRTSRERSLATGVLDMTRSDSELATDFWASPTKARSRGYLLLGSQYEVILGK